MGARRGKKDSVDTIRTLAEQRHFFTSELELEGYGRVLMIGDQTAVEYMRQMVSEHEAHILIDVTDEENRSS